MNIRFYSSPFDYASEQTINASFDRAMRNLWIIVIFPLFKFILSKSNLDFCCIDWHCKEAGKILYNTYGCVRKNINVSAGQLHYLEHILCMKKLSEQHFIYLKQIMGLEACIYMVSVADEVMEKWKHSMHDHFTRYDRIVPHYLSNRLKEEHGLLCETLLLRSPRLPPYNPDITLLHRKTVISKKARLVFVFPNHYLPSWCPAYLY